MKIRTLFCCFAAAMLLTVCACAADIVDSGKCGDNLTWTLDSDGVLTISGTGAMDDWNYTNNAPWSENRGDIITVVIQSGVKSIGDSAFSYCGYMMDVTIPDSVTSIGERAFSGCSELTSVTIPESVTSIGREAFAPCNNLHSILVASNNRNYVSKDGVLFDKNQTTLICHPAGKSGPYEIPAGVTAIDDGAFLYCDDFAMRTIKIPDGVISIGNSAFDKCFWLESIIIPDSVTFIGEIAFQDCWNLQSVTIPHGVTAIGDNMFAYCENLKSVIIPDTVTSIGDSAFCNCEKLDSVTIPDSVTTIGWGAFSDCKSLTSITLPNGIDTIDSHTFDNCVSLTSVTIPDSVTTIEWAAFSGCKSLTDVYYGGSATQWKEIVYYGSNATQWKEISGYWGGWDDLQGVTIHYNVNAQDIGVGITLTDKDGKSIDGNGKTGETEKENAFQDGAEFKADFKAVDPNASSGLVTASVFIIFYDRDGFMVDLTQKEIDLSDPLNLLFVLDIHIPEGAKTLKFLMLGDGLEPLRAARMIESSADA